MAFPRPPMLAVQTPMSSCSGWIHHSANFRSHDTFQLRPVACRLRPTLAQLPSSLVWRLPSSHFTRACGEAEEVPEKVLKVYGPHLPKIRNSSGRFIFLVYFMHLLSFTMGGPLLPMLRKHFHLVAAKTGLLTSAFPFGMLFALAVFPGLSDRYGRRPILIICFSGLTCGFLLQAKALLSNWSFETFLIFRALSGAFAGCAVVIKAFIADAYNNPKRLPQAMALREATGTASYIVGPTLGGILISLGGIASITLTGAVLSIASIFILLRMAPTPQVKRGRAKPGDDASGTMPLQLVSVVIFVHGLYGLGQSVFEAFFGVWCFEHFGLGPASVGTLLTCLACLVFLAHTCLYRVLVNEFGVVDVAVMGLLSMAFAFLAMCAGTLSWVLLFYAFGVPSFTPSVPILLAKLAPAHQRGRLIAVDAGVMSLARILSPALLGLLYENGPLRAFTFSACALVLGAGLMASQARAAEDRPKRYHLRWFDRLFNRFRRGILKLKLRLDEF